MIGIGASSAFGAVIKIASPQGGAEYEIGKSVLIEWYLENPKGMAKNGGYIYLYASSDDGKSWYEIGGPANYDVSQYYWETNNENVGKYRIQLREENREVKRYTPIHETTTTEVFTLFENCSTPTFTSHPQDIRSCTGESIVLTAKSDAVPGSMYEWYKDGQLYSTTKSPAMGINNVTRNDAGSYYVKVIQECGTDAVSKTAQVTIGTATSILSNPIPGISLCENGRVFMSVSARGDDLAYQWRKNGVGIPDAKSPTLTFDPARPTDAGSYDVVVTGTCGAPITSTATVVEVFAQPVVTSKPTATTVCAGQPLVLSLTTTGSGLLYQWYKNGVVIPGANDATYRVQSASIGDEGNYGAVIRTGPNAPIECARTINVDPVVVSVFKSPIITAQPQNTVGCVGKISTLTVQVNGFDLKYQWYKNGQVIAGATGYTLTLQNLKLSDAGQYTVAVIGTCALNMMTQPATLTVTTSPRLMKSPTAQTVNAGQTVVLDAATDIEGTTVQWYRNSLPVPGATTAHYEIPNAQVSASGEYYAVFTGNCSGVVTAPARVWVNDPQAQSPRLTLSMSILDFGEIPTGYTSSRTVSGIISNTGNAPLEIQSINTAAPTFVLVDGPSLPLTLAPGESTPLTIKATAGPVGELAGSMIITSNDPIGTDKVELLGQSVLRYSHPETVSFPMTEETKSAEQCFEVKNNTSFEITLTDALITGVDMDQFSLVTALPLTIAANASSDMCIHFAPTSLGSMSAVLALLSANGGNSSLSISGTGVVLTSVNEDMQSDIVAFPNPSQGTVTLRSHGVAIVAARVVSAMGASVATIDAGSLVWNGCDNSGTPVAAGVYTIVATTSTGVVTLPVVVNR